MTQRYNCLFNKLKQTELKAWLDWASILVAPLVQICSTHVSYFDYPNQVSVHTARK